VDDNRAVAKERTDTRLSRSVEVGVAIKNVRHTSRSYSIRHWAWGELRGGKWVGVNRAVLAAKITNLASLGLGAIARRVLATLERVQVGESGKAAAIGCYGLVVDMVD